MVLDILVQSRRDGAAAKRFFKRLLNGLQYTPRVLVTDKLKSYGVARRELLPGVEHRGSRYLNNGAEKSHRPTAGESGRCSGSSRCARHSVSYPLTPSSLATFAHGVIA